MLAAGIGCCSFLLVGPTYDIQDALERGLISVEFTSNGKSSKECVTMTTRNLSGKTFYLTVEPGYILHTVDPDAQDILITRPENILVKANSSTLENLYGFCSQSTNSTPSEDSKFARGEYASEPLRELAAYLSKNQVDPNLEQDAVWTVSSGHPVASIYEEDDPHSEDLKGFCADLMGVEMPWYNVEYGDVLDAPFIDEPLVLSGEMVYWVNTVGYADLVVLDPDGEVLVTFFEHTIRKPGATYTQRFTFEATNMKRGDYHFSLVLEGQVVEDQVITL